MSDHVSQSSSGNVLPAISLGALPGDFDFDSLPYLDGEIDKAVERNKICLKEYLDNPNYFLKFVTTDDGDGSVPHFCRDAYIRPQGLPS
jgi:hypothetical protein